MPFFSRVFKSKESAAKKQAKSNGEAPVEPAKPQWTDAWLRTNVSSEEVQELLHGCTNELKARALDMPFLLLPFRPRSDPSAARTFIRNYFSPPSDRHMPLRGEALMTELRLAEPMVLCSVMKWCWSRLAGGVVTWEAYELFKVGEHDSQLARDAFATFIPISVESDARARIIFDFFDLMAAIAAHGKTNGLTGRKLSRYAGWWAFEISDNGKGFDTGYSSWSKAADATSHLFFAYLRSLSPDSSRSGILSLPLSLQTLLQATEYPPETPTLMQTATTKVVMIVDVVSPTPFSLLRRAKNFQYRDDDQALQQFAEYEDPVQALTDECRRVLKSISSTNQSAVSTSKASTSLKDASWSRFEDIGFGSLTEDEEIDEEFDAAGLGAKRPQQNMRFAPRSRTADMGRPTTPSWADFLSSGFVDEEREKAPALLLPPDKQLPPINSMRVQSSQSHRRMNDNDSALEPGELASINTVDLDDSFWWVWISSLAGEEPPSRKAAFGRCALIETRIVGGRWLIMEEQVKGAAPEPAPGAYIAEKKSFFGFTTKKGRLTRRKSAIKKPTLAPPDESLQNGDGMMSKTSIAPDQHARIQAAAAALQKKHREQEVASQNGVRRGRADEETRSNKTSSVFTLQPVIMNEASPAMKWASQYDKNEIRAAYLGNSQAGRGISTDDLAKVANGKNKENVPVSVSSRSMTKEAEKNRDLPALPGNTPKSSLLNVSSARRDVSPTPPPLPTAPVGSVEQSNQAAAEAAEVPLPSTTPMEKSMPQTQPAEAPKTPTPGDESQTATKSADGRTSTTPEKGPPPATKRLVKKNRNSGIKGMFGRKKEEEEKPQSAPDNATAVAAARAALEGRTKSPTSPSPTPPAPAAPAAATKTSRFGKKKTAPTEPNVAPTEKVAEDPVQAATPEPHREDEPQNASTTAEVEAPTQMPHASLSAPVPEEDERPDLSRVTTNERLQADREFSSFDQGPLTDQPAFVPKESPSSTPPLQSPPVTVTYQKPVIPGTKAVDPDVAPEQEPQEEELTKTSSASQDRWAQIRKNAQERAVRHSEEQSQLSQTAQTDDGETSGEETIESRVARIKARVAELTGNMDNAASSHRP